ncbi:MAG: LysR family transcriptional regulator, partial [Bryobacterales bacterium]|nr:LysR family transcriptional regulator [Bryobacterales bacterium]
NRLTDLQAFATVARLRSFRRAATELGVSPSALSHSLRGLEGRLGVRLLNRSTRSVAPTEAGQRLLDRLAPALLDIDIALEALNAFRDSPVGTLRFNAPRHAAEHVLAPLANRFLLANPGAVLLLDEPDAHLEILRQRDVYNLITEIAAGNGSQIVAASHSEVVLQEAAERDVVMAFVGAPHRI